MEEQKVKEIQEIVKTAQHLADNDPGSFIILKSNMEILKARCDMQKLKEERPVAQAGQMLRIGENEYIY